MTQLTDREVLDRLTRIETRFDGLETLLTQRIYPLEDRSAALQNKITKLEGRAVEAEKQIEKLETQLSALQRQTYILVGALAVVSVVAQILTPMLIKLGAG